MTWSALGSLLIYFVLCHCYEAPTLSIAVEWLGFVLRIREVWDQNLTWIQVILKETFPGSPHSL